MNAATTQAAPVGAAKALTTLATPPEIELVALALRGDVHSLDLLFRRHLPRLRALATQLCADPIAAEDTCQEACRKALNNLRRLRQPERFGTWLAGFVINEARHERRSLRNSRFSGTEVLSNGTNSTEAMSVSALIESESDLKTMLHLLSREIQHLAKPNRLTGACMLQTYRQHGEFPPVRVIAACTHLSLGSAERAREAVLRAWQSLVRRLLL